MSHQATPSRNTSQASQLSVEPHLPTHRAAFRNDVKKLKHLMEEEGAPYLDEESLETPLHVAARCRSDAVVKYLLDADRSAVLAKAVNGSTPAHYAAIYGQLSTLKLLLEDGGNRRNDVAKEKDTQGLTVLHLASLKGDEQVVEYLLLNFRELEDIPNEAEDYPIHFASASGHLNVVRTFVKICGKVVVNKEDVNGTLPVYFAAQEGKLQVVRYLIMEVGADPVARDNDGLTTLHAATQGGHLDVVRWVVSELGEEFIIDETQDGATPIHIAAAMGYPDILEWFFNRKEGNSYVNLRDRNKRTPCHDAAEYGNMEALIMLLKYGAKTNMKDNDGKTPLMLAEVEHEEIASLIMEYDKEGAKVLSHYDSSVSNGVAEESPYAVIDAAANKHARKPSASSIRTSRTEHVELVSALNELNEVQEYRLRRQESLQAIENELKTENIEEKPPHKKSKKSTTGFPDKSVKGSDEILDQDHYAADSGDIYARSRKQSSARQGSGHVKKSSSSHGIREMERKKSPPSHWYTGIAEDGSHDNRSNYSRSHRRRHEPEDETSLYSYISSGSRPHAPRSVHSSGYSGHSMASAYRHGHFMPYPGYGYGNYGYPMYPGPRGYPGPAGYPPVYPPYGYPPPPPMMGRQRPPQRRGRGEHGKPSPDGPLHSVSSHQTTGDAPKGRKTKAKSPSIDYAAHDTKGEQMIGYGPEISDDKGSSNKNQDEDADFHPPPPPITKDGEMKEFVTTEDQNFIMVKRTTQSRTATVHPSGLQLNPAKQPFVYDGRYDAYIEPDEEWEDADPNYGVPVLAACAAILGIGVVTSLKGVARRMNISGLITPTNTTKDRAYESVAWDSTTVSSAQASGRLQKKMTSSSSLRGNLLFDSVDDMDTEELDPIEYSLREESGVTKTKGNANMIGKSSTPGKPEYRSATLPSKRKAIMQMDFSDDHFAKMTPQYRESVDDTHVDQLGGGLGESLQSRNASMLDLAPSGFRDGEHTYDSEELEGVENIVHRDLKNTEKSKESHSKQEESVTIGVTSTKVTENSKVHKEKKKKERSKGRNEKKTLASLQPSPPKATQQSSISSTEVTKTEIENSTLQQTTSDVDHSELKQTSSISITNSLQNSSQLLDQVESTESQQFDGEQSTSQMDSQEKALSASANYWHVTMMESNQATMEDAIAQLTSQSLSQQSAVEKVNSDSRKAQPTSVMVEVSSVEEQQQPKLITVDAQDTPYPPQPSYNVFQKQDSAQKTSVAKRQDSFNSQMMSHQVTMEKTISQTSSYTQQNDKSLVGAPLPVTTPSAVTMLPSVAMTPVVNKSTAITMLTAVTKPTDVTMQSAATVLSTNTMPSTVTLPSRTPAIITASTIATPSAVTVPLAGKQSTESIDESDGSPQAPDNDQDFDFPDMKFNDILNDLLELSGEAESAKKTSTNKKESTEKTAAEFHTMSLFSDVPIAAPPLKSEPVNKQKKESSQVAITVKKQEVTKQKATENSTGSATSNKMQSTSVANNEPADKSFVIKKEPLSSKTTKESISMTTSKPAAADKQNVPLAISHKKEMQQQKDGTDLEWGIELSDIDDDLASQLEELNSIIGQLGVEPSNKDKVVVDAKMDGQTVHNDNTAISTQVDQFRDSTSAVQQLKHDNTTAGGNVTIDSNLIVTLSNVNSKVASNVQLTKEETILLYETRRKVVTNIVEYCMVISKGDKSAALNLALTLSTTYNFDAATISEITTYINTGKYTEMGVLPGNKLTLMVDSNNSRSGSAVSLLSPEAEQALLKQQEQHMRTTERHFQEQAIVQSDLKKQLLEQSKLQQEAQRQSMSFAEAQSRQSRMLEEAQRQVQEQAERLRQAELKLKEAEYMSKEKALESDRERILREAQEQQRRAQKDYEEKNNLIITMQNQLMEMQEFQKKLMQRFEEQNQTHAEKIAEYQNKLAKAERRVRIRDDRGSESEEEPMMTAVGPSLQSKIMSHAEARTMEAHIQRAQPLSNRLMAEESIPGAPPLPNVEILLDNKTRLKNRTSTMKAAERSASVFNKFEKGAFGDDNDNDDEEMEFAQPKLMSQGATEAKTALIKHTSNHTVEIPDHGYYRSTYSIPPTTRPTNMKTFEKMPGDFHMRHYKVPQ